MFNLKIYFTLSFFLILYKPHIYSQANNCEVIKYATNYEIKKDKLVKIDSTIIQINNRMSERFTEVKIPYTKNQKVSEVNAWIEDAAGILVRKLKSSDITDRSSISDFSLYEDDFVKTFSLKHNTYPYRIVYTYKITSKQFISIQWVPILFPTVPTQNAKLTLVTPKGYPIHKYEKNLRDPQIDTLESSVRYVWSAVYKKPIQDEIFSISPDKVLPSVNIVPFNFVYGVEGSSKDWSAFGNWQYRLIKDSGDLPEDEKTRVTPLIKGITDKREVVKILYHYLQDHTRYVNVSVDIGGLKPYPASYVAQNKYGDCKALSNYMKALLSFAGIHSFYTAIYRGYDPPEISKHLPGPQYFNHVILTVPLDKDTIWIENTSNVGPFGYLSPDIQNREAFLVDEFHSKLIKMPVLNKFDVATSVKTDVTFNENGSANAVFKLSFKGNGFDYFNQLKSDLNKDEQDELIRKSLKISNFNLIHWELNKPHRDSARIDLTLNLILDKALKSLGEDHYFNTFGIGIPLFTMPNERNNPVEISIPIFHIDSVTYHLPVNYEIKSIPEQVHISSAFGNFEFLVKSNGSTIEVIKKFELFTGTYSLKQYSDFYNFISSANEKDKAKILIVNKITHKQ